MTIPTSSAEHAPFAPPFVPSPRLRAAIGELLQVGAPRSPDMEGRLSASLAWIARAQDACASGALSGGFTLLRGWRAADVEATAAAVVAFPEIAEALGDAELDARARRAARALASHVPPSATPRHLAVAVRALCRWSDVAPEAERRGRIGAAARLADRLVSALDASGADVSEAASWEGVAGVAAALCAAGATLGEARLAERGASLLDRAAAESSLHHAAAMLARQPNARWPRPRGTSLLPTLLRDVRDAALRLGRRDLLGEVEAEIETLLRRFELRRRLSVGAPSALRRRVPGRFSPLGWSAAALLWIEESERRRDPRPLNAALFALDGLFEVQRRRPGVDDVDGAVPATVHLWRDRRVPSYDSLTAVTLTRAMVAARRVVSSFDGTRRASSWWRATEVPRSVDSHAAEAGSPTLERTVPRVVLYAAPDIHRAPRLLEQWREWGFVPAAVVMERRPRPPLATRIWRRVAEDGWRVALDRIARRVQPRAEAPADESTLDYCARRGIRVVDVGAFDDPATLDVIRALAPDLAVHVGKGILRAPILAIPRLGTLNIHNGVLPRFRGLNVAEWSALLGEPVGCTVHLVDPGVDTGDILLVRDVDVRGARSVDELRHLVDRAQGPILGEVLKAIVSTGGLPPRRSQRPDEGRQFFRMHPTLREMLGARLRARH